MADPTITSPTALRKIQIGQETTPGTSVPATIKLPATAKIEENIMLKRPKYQTGTLADAINTQIVGEEVKGSLNFEDLCFSSILYPLNMALKKKTWPDYGTVTQVKLDTATVFTDLEDCMDEDEATSETIAAWIAATSHVCVCSATKFRAIRVKMGATVNAVTAVISVKCSKGDTTWLDAVLVRDGTSSGGKTLAQDGIIEFTAPAGWASDTVDGESGYWIQLTASASPTVDLKIAEIYVIPEACIWTFTPTLTSADAPNPCTIEYGNGVEETDVSYVIGEKLELAIAMNEPMVANLDIIGQNLQVSSFTSGLSLPTNMETILAKKCQLFIDALDGTIGSTEKAGTLIDAKFTFNGFAPAYHGSSSLYFDALHREAYHCELDMTFQFNTITKAQRLIYQAGTQQLFRLKIAGTTIAGGVTNSVTIDMCGVITSFSSLDEKDGADTISLKVEGELNSSTWAKLFEIVVVNKEAVLV